jgi:ppGpp synthetase/RelA/SpoT-type nucleotidyltranferase
VNIPQPLIEAYSALTPFLQEVEKRVTNSLRPYTQERLLPFIARIKTIESAAEKIETGRYKSFHELDDLVACTMVIPNLPDEREAVAFCSRSFYITEVKQRSAIQKRPDLFRFDSTRLYGFLSRPEGMEDAADSIFKIKFEIQIRTAFEHAWIVSTHPLTYKSDYMDWKRFRLSAQIKAAAEHLDLTIVQFEQLAAAVEESPWPELGQKKQIVNLIKKLSAERVIPSEANPKDMTRFADNLIGLLKASKKKVTIEQAISELDAQLRSFTAETFPRSASLLQVCMGNFWTLATVLVSRD